MTVSAETEAEVRRLYFAEHWKRGTIASQLGIHPDVVDPGAIAMFAEQRRRQLGLKPKVLTTFAPHVIERDVVTQDLGGYDE
jgi:hypothetical protein